MKVSIDSTICQGHARCHALCPEVFDVDELGRGVVIVDEVPENLIDLSRLAAEDCPERAIAVHESDKIAEG